MQTIASRISLAVTGALLLSCTIGLVTVQTAETCRPSDGPKPRTPRVAMAGSPTLAPPREVVRVQVETDRSDIEVSWAE